MGYLKQEQAIRAIDSALEKMAKQDFPGAKKLALKAGKLKPDLEGIAQIILVCDVHSRSGPKGAPQEGGGGDDERDWYKVLDLDPKVADEDSVRHQYNKMALNLHPDRNRLPGATEAFQLVCRAKAVLTDDVRRKSYDRSRRKTKALEESRRSDFGFSVFKNGYLGFAAFQGSTSAKLQDLGFTGFRNGSSPFGQGVVNNLQEGCGNAKLQDSGFAEFRDGFDLSDHESLKNLNDGAGNAKLQCSGFAKFRDGPGPFNLGVSSNIKDGGANAKLQDPTLAKIINGTGINGSHGGCGVKSQFPGNFIAQGPTQGIPKLEYWDSELNDFEKKREKVFFSPGKIWAIYDTLDAMPRFYARINNVISSDNFKVHITWLEPYPDNEMEKKWLCKGLPASCGKFKLGESEEINDRAIFSHLVDSEKNVKSSSNIYRVYPRKGETWAVFKNWKMDWCLAPEIRNVNTGHEFDFVEIMSDYSDDLGVSVGFLGKIKGFSTLFSRMNGEEVKILAKDKLGFSHRVSSFEMMSPNGNSRFFELDPASLPGFGFSEISTMNEKL